MGCVYILGGGPTGLALADVLGEAGARFTLIERQPRCGGLAQTLAWGCYGKHDLGPHKIFTKDEALLKRVKSLLPPEAWITRAKKSSIFLRGHYLPYPPSPFSLLPLVGVFGFIELVLKFLSARIYSLVHRSPIESFEQDITLRVGAGLYEILFKPLAEKIWGDPRVLDPKLSRGRIQTPSVVEILSRALGISKRSQFEALTFDYPRGGLQELWTAIEQRSSPTGEYLLRTGVERIELSDGRVAALHLKNMETNQQFSISISQDDFIFSTLPLRASAHACGEDLSASLRQQIEKIETLNDLWLVFFFVRKRDVIRDSWIFIPDESTLFHRISEQESFDPDMTVGGSILCCEVMARSDRPRGWKTESELITQCREGIARLGLDVGEFIDQRVIALPRSYPVFQRGVEKLLAEILESFDQIKNFRTVGRQGAFNYIGTLDAMDIGYGAAQWYLDGASAASWQQERTRTQHYPVLD